MSLLHFWMISDTFSIVWLVVIFDSTTDMYIEIFTYKFSLGRRMLLWHQNEKNNNNNIVSSVWSDLVNFAFSWIYCSYIVLLILFCFSPHTDI